jgi:glutamyl-tRNA(Gln) amidotransferase subunit E
MFDVLCRNEAVRQHTLIRIGKKMKRRGIKKEHLEHTYIDISHLFSLKKDNRAFVTIFPKMKGLSGEEVQPDKDFGLDIFEKSMLITGIPCEDHFHSDETKKKCARAKRSGLRSRLPIDKKKYSEICSILNPKPEDAFVVVVGPERRAMHAMKKIVERAKMALDGVPQETRRLLPNGNTEFLRMIHGKERIYPDTDTPPIVINREVIQQCVEKVGKRPWEIYDDLHSRYNLGQYQVDLLIRDEKVEKFYDYTEKLKLGGSTAYHLLIELRRSERRKGAAISDHIIDQLANALSRSLIIPEQIPLITEILAKQPDLAIEKALERL